MTLKDLFIQTWQNEIPVTLSAINGLPDDITKLDYRCNEKARSADEILGHALGHAEVMYNAADSFIADEKSAHNKFTNKKEIADYFENYASKLGDKLRAIDDKTWNEQPIDFRLDGQSLFAYPMSDTYWMLLFDLIHHRGQLSTYYRHMGVRNPQIYGPAAEDMEELLASKK